jgi:hypothetical protein
MDYLNIIAGYVGLTPEDIKKNIENADGTIKDVAESYLQDLLKAKADKLVFTDEKKKEMAENFEKKGFAAAMATVNTKLSEIYPQADIKPDSKLDDVITNIKSMKVQPIPEDQVKLHPIYRELEKNTVPRTELEKVNNEFEAYKKGITREQHLSKIKTIAEQLLDGYKMPEDVGLKSKRLDAFISNSFGGFDFENDGDDLILIKDGKRFEDKSYNAVTAKKRIEEQADIFFDRKVKGTPPGTPPEKQEDRKPDAQQEPRTIHEFNATRSKLSGKELLDYSEKYKSKFQ